MKKILFALLLSLSFAFPAQAYRPMTVQDMTDEQLLRHYQSMEYKQGYYERESLGLTSKYGGGFMAGLAESNVKEAMQRKNTARLELEKRGLRR
jgi:hypothetical protein